MVAYLLLLAAKAAYLERRRWRNEVYSGKRAAFVR